MALKMQIIRAQDWIVRSFRTFVGWNWLAGLPGCGPVTESAETANTKYTESKMSRVEFVFRFLDVCVPFLP